MIPEGKVNVDVWREQGYRLRAWDPQVQEDHGVWRGSDLSIAMYTVGATALLIFEH